MIQLSRSHLAAIGSFTSNNVSPLHTLNYILLRKSSLIATNGVSLAIFELKSKSHNSSDILLYPLDKKIVLDNGSTLNKAESNKVGRASKGVYRINSRIVPRSVCEDMRAFPHVSQLTNVPNDVTWSVRTDYADDCFNFLSGLSPEDSGEVFLGVDSLSDRLYMAPTTSPQFQVTLPAFDLDVECKFSHSPTLFGVSQAEFAKVFALAKILKSNYAKFHTIRPN